MINSDSDNQNDFINPRGETPIITGFPTEKNKSEWRTLMRKNNPVATRSFTNTIAGNLNKPYNSEAVLSVFLWFSQFLANFFYFFPLNEDLKVFTEGEKIKIQ